MSLVLQAETAWRRTYEASYRRGAGEFKKRKKNNLFIGDGLDSKYENESKQKVQVLLLASTIYSSTIKCYT